MSSKLEQLLQQLCPNGVEFIPLVNLTRVLRGKRLTKKELSTEGVYPVFHGGLEPLGYYGSFNREAHSVMVINVGASAGSVAYCDKPFWSSDGCFCVEHCNQILPRFLYYYFCSIEKCFVSKVRYAGIPTLDASVVESIKVPVPPLEVQEEIVRMLDKFTELTVELTTELTAELTSRKKQYEYYRDLLLNFNNWKGCNALKIRELRVCDIVSVVAAPRKLQKSDYLAQGMYPIVSQGQERIVGYTNDETDCLPFAEYVIFGDHTREVKFVDYSFAQGADGLKILKAKASVLSRYLYHAFKNLVIPNRGYNRHWSIVSQMIISLPDLHTQKRIVEKLDAFEKLCNDLTADLPAEIEARRKQYEYYRDKLLTFQPLKQA